MKLDRLLTFSGAVLIFTGLLLFIFIFYPVLRVEFGYWWAQSHTDSPSVSPQPMAPIDTEFGIVIPKIGARARVIPEVDPYDSQKYQQALTKGVAHAKGSATPDQNGNIFLFSHSSANLLEASRFNSIFYLIHKLEKGDSVELYFKGTKFTYLVTGKKLVSGKDVSYLRQIGDGKTLTLMTCWPPGTDYERLLVTAVLQ